MRSLKKFFIVLVIFCCVLLNFTFAQEYTTYGASSNMAKQNYKKTQTLLIFSCSDNFLWNRVMEESLKEKFLEQGITTHLVTDYVDVITKTDFSSEDLHEIHTKTRVSFLMQINCDGAYTYEYGGGLAKIDTTVLVYNWDANLLLKMGLSTEADTNDMLSFNATRKPALESLAKAIVQEYMKYVK